MNDLHNNFLKAVKTLSLKFPASSIAKATGYGVSIVSEYLNSKKEVSETFAEKFCEVYKFDFEEMKKAQYFDSSIGKTPGAFKKFLFEVRDKFYHIVKDLDYPDAKLEEDIKDLEEEIDFMKYLLQQRKKGNHTKE